MSFIKKILNFLFSKKSEYTSNGKIYDIFTFLGIKFKHFNVVKTYSYLKTQITQFEQQIIVQQNQLKQIDISVNDLLARTKEDSISETEFCYENDDSILILNTIMNKNTLIYDNNVYIFSNNYIMKGSKIGRFSYIGEYSRVDFGVSIGRYCSIANNVLIGATIHPQNWLSTSPFQYDKWLSQDTPKKTWQIYKNTVIGNDVWIGAHAIIQSGVKIGDGAIIGSGAIVTKDVPPYAIVVGSPAKILKYRFNDDMITKLSKLEWWNLPHDQIVQLDFENVEKVIEVLSK